jgi:hypothetical protein
MPSVSGWFCDDGWICLIFRAKLRFYALDVGLVLRPEVADMDPTVPLAVSMPSMSGWFCDVSLGLTFLDQHIVSMPSMSGWFCDGSLEPSLLTCGDARSCERSRAG